MQNNNDSDSGRSKLTLKLKMPANVDTKSLVGKSKGFEDVKFNRSAVQVTIKGRKKDSSSKVNESQSNLDVIELEARVRAVSKNSKDSFIDEIKINDKLNVLEKIAVNKKNSESIKLNKEKVQENILADNIDNIESKDIEINENKVLESNKIIASEIISQKDNEDNNNLESSFVEDEVNLKLTVDNFEDKQIQEEKIENKNHNLIKKKVFVIDNFDVRNKIRQSIENSNREREEKEKFTQEKKRLELEKIEQQKVVQQKITNERSVIEKERKSKVKVSYNELEDLDSKGKKRNIKEEKINSRRLTYFIGSGQDEEEGFSRRRKKQKKVELKDSKDYKKIIREVSLPELITVADLAERMAEKVGDVVKKLFAMGTVATSNQVIDVDTAEIIISEFGHVAKRVAFADVENVLEEDEMEFEKLSRAPVVTIMGHVDHGKTSLLDALRETNVVQGEHGGITQHIGASRIKTNSGKFITFLDTPGHEAFTEMRSRGANVTDIVILVVAADDGVKEQTIEAINHAKAANVPVIVAVNKIDKPGCDPSRVKNELLSHGIIAEELGGDSIFIEVSAKQKINLDKLEEAILLQAEMLDLKSRYKGKSSGVVVESRVDNNKGVVVTVLVQKGTLDVGDIVVVGTAFGRVRKMTDDKGKNIKTATPSMPVELLGLDSAPNAGDNFVEVNEEKDAREISSYRLRKLKEEKSMKNSARSFADVFKESGKGSLKYLNILIKGDVHGSVEALQGSILKLNNEEVAIKVIHGATGGITQSDVNLAVVSNAIIIGFNVRANIDAKELAENKSIDIRYYSIIYNVVDDLKMLLSGMLNPTKNEQYLGQAEIRQIFKISGSGKIAGGSVIDGIIKKNGRIRLLRDNIVVHDGSLKTLKRFKDDVKEVKNGFECGFSIDGYDDIKEKDIIECYEITEQKRSL
ncbi:MAG: translation initiation factor IF-2 [Rickettsiales bacterium]|nr:translation initiation factor IF-2 [Rickettsiales bacterium]